MAFGVLILVLVEVPIGVDKPGVVFFSCGVLILVLVEVPIGETDQKTQQTKKQQVLILVLVEVPIGAQEPESTMRG